MEDLVLRPQIKVATDLESNVKESTRSRHPYLDGNFYPQKTELHLVECNFEGTIPPVVAGGQYLRNGPNPSLPPAPEQPYHWFDGDGMVHGVYFHQDPKTGCIVPRYVNKQVKTDVLIASHHWTFSLMPSIATLIDPISTTALLLKAILRTAILSFLSGSTRISVANTSLVFHDNRLLANCENGPPMTISAPELETLGWQRFLDPDTGRNAGMPGSFDEWSTAHPKVDPESGDLITFGYNIFAPPYVRYSVIGSDGRHKTFQQPLDLPESVMMHDFAVTKTQSIIFDLPLSLSPFNAIKGVPMISFNPLRRARFGVFPRLYKAGEDEIIWFKTDACMIFHSANAWDEIDEKGEVNAVCMVACRFQGAKLVHAAAGMAAPGGGGTDVVHLFYYRFDLKTRQISHAYPLSDFPMEFPTVNPAYLTMKNHFIYGASLSSGSFDAALSGAKIDTLVKVDVQERIKSPPMGVTQETANLPPSGSGVKKISLPPGHFASEANFAPSRPDDPDAEEDDGYLFIIVYDEARLDPVTGDAPDDDPDASSVWIIDAKTFSLPPIAKIRIPQRIPFGLHGTWVSRQQLESQENIQINVDGQVELKPGTKTRTATSISALTSLWKWQLVWAGNEVKRGVGDLGTLSFGLSALVAWVLFLLMTWDLWAMLGGCAIRKVF
ncbi:hypothetical protein YB2330_006127 [Saitoella coloradoensis]